MPSANLVNLERVSKSFGVRPLLTDVSLGVLEGERIGIVGRNGDGKTTLLNVITGNEEADTGRVSRQRGLLTGYLRQDDDLVEAGPVDLPDKTALLSFCTADAFRGSEIGAGTRVISSSSSPTRAPIRSWWARS